MDVLASSARPGYESGTTLKKDRMMIFAYWMVLAAVFLPYLTVAIAKAPGGINNNAPRLGLDNLSGWRQRADWAHRNHFEAFPPFAAAVIIAEISHLPQIRVDALAGAFVALRVVYTAMYVVDRATLRSIAWALAFLCVLGLLVCAAVA
jgi:uncharacterized MAPEG superfamily protein